MLWDLLRIRQYYKNLVIFLPLLFTAQLFIPVKFIAVLIGFISLCLISSSSYIINDIFDREADRLHPEKKFRPIASGKVSILCAFIASIVLAVLSLAISLLISNKFPFIILAIFALTSAYTVFLKHEQFADISLISINFVLRAVGGAWIINAKVSPWLILCLFFLALFLAIGKREGELYFNEKTYSKRITNSIMIISTALLVISYSLYSFMSIYPSLIFSLPFAIYTILRYFHLVETASIIARQPELFIKDKRLVFGILLWVFSVFAVIYI
ncbi:UbiA family prenyltransferase [archaeon]|nr:UbiA family prenyltransferase [archaeon]